MQNVSLFTEKKTRMGKGCSQKVLQMSMDGRGQGGLPVGGGMHPGPAGHGTSAERGENIYHQFLCDS